MIVLPRQARDKHRDYSKRRCVSASAGGEAGVGRYVAAHDGGCAQVRRGGGKKTKRESIAMPFYTKNATSFYHQDRLGTNIGKKAHSKRECVRRLSYRMRRWRCSTTRTAWRGRCYRCDIYMYINALFGAMFIHIQKR